MQQMPPPSGGLFPDAPQQQSAPRFASNAPQSAPQAYEPQGRMPSAAPVMPQVSYATGQLRTLHGTQPVTQAPPMAAMPTAQAYQAQQAARPQPQQQTAAPQAQQTQAIQGTPLMVHTIHGIPVAVSAEEMERALEEHASKSGQKQTGKKKQKKEIRGKQKQSGSFVIKFSVVWFIFGAIGVITVVLLLLEWVGMPLLVMLNDLTTGGAT